MKALNNDNLNYLLSKTPKILPNNPTAQGWTAERIKKCYYEGFIVLFEFLKITQEEFNLYSEQTQEQFADIAVQIGSIIDGTTIVKKAYCDENGNNIKDIYATKENFLTVLNQILDNIKENTAPAIFYIDQFGKIKEIYTLQDTITDILDGNIASAKAVSDEDGNNIQETYVKKEQIAVSKEDDSSKLATIEVVQSFVDSLIDGASDSLDTLKELAGALNDDANFSANVLNKLTELQNSKMDIIGGLTTEAFSLTANNFKFISNSNQSQLSELGYYTNLIKENGSSDWHVKSFNVNCEEDSKFDVKSFSVNASKYNVDASELKFNANKKAAFSAYESIVVDSSSSGVGEVRQKANKKIEFDAIGSYKDVKDENGDYVLDEDGNRTTKLSSGDITAKAARRVEFYTYYENHWGESDYITSSFKMYDEKIEFKANNGIDFKDCTISNAVIDGYIPTTSIGTEICPLDVNGYIPSSYLPAYIEGELFVVKETSNISLQSQQNFSIHAGLSLIASVYQTGYFMDNSHLVSRISMIQGKMSVGAINGIDFTGSRLSNAVIDGYIPTTSIGTDICPLDSSGKVPASYLPSYVDDCLEYENLASFPTQGDSGKIYVNKENNKIYRWSGTIYTEISSSLAVGETSSTAYPGDKGKQNADDIQSVKEQLDTLDTYYSDEVSRLDTSKLDNAVFLDLVNTNDEHSYLGYKFENTENYFNFKIKNNTTVQNTESTPATYSTVMQFALSEKPTLAFKNLNKISIKDIPTINISNVAEIYGVLTSKLSLTVGNSSKIFCDDYQFNLFSGSYLNLDAGENVVSRAVESIYNEAGTNLELRIGGSLYVDYNDVEGGTDYVAKIGMYKSRTFNGITGSMIQIGGTSKGETGQGSYLESLVIDRTHHIMVDMNDSSTKTDIDIAATELIVNDGHLVVAGNNLQGDFDETTCKYAGTREGVNTDTDFYKYGVEEGVFAKIAALESENATLRAQIAALDSRLSALDSRVAAIEANQRFQVDQL